MKSSRTVLNSVAAALLLLPTWCSQSAAQNAAIRLGGVSVLASDPFFVSLMCGASKEAKANGATLDWKAIQGRGAQELATSLDAVALTSPDGIVISGNDVLSAKISGIMANGTPVVAVNVPIRPATQYADVASTSDNKPFALSVAKDLGSSGSVAILAGIAGSAVLALRYQPFVDALKEIAPSIKVLEPQYDKLDRTAAASITSALILANPDLKAIYSVSGPAGAGAASAVALAGKIGQIKIFTYDATPEVVQALKTGTITAALAQAPAKLGADSVKVILARIKEKKPGAVTRDESKNVMLPPLMLTKDNVSSASSVDYLYSSECK